MDLTAQLKRDEAAKGFNRFPYRDTKGNLTIGYGHNLSERGITQEIADLLLEDDKAVAIAELRKRFDWFDGLSQPRQNALINMCFNLGITRFMGFHKMLLALDNGDFHTAALEMLNSDWHDELGARVERIARQLETDAYV